MMYIQCYIQLIFANRGKVYRTNRPYALLLRDYYAERIYFVVER